MKDNLLSGSEGMHSPKPNKGNSGDSSGRVYSWKSPNGTGSKSSILTVILGSSVLILCIALIVTIHKLNRDLEQEKLERLQEKFEMNIQLQKAMQATKETQAVLLQAIQHIREIETELEDAKKRLVDLEIESKTATDALEKEQEELRAKNEEVETLKEDLRVTHEQRAFLELQTTKLTEERDLGLARIEELHNTVKEGNSQVIQLQEQLTTLRAEKEQSSDQTNGIVEALHREAVQIREQHEASLNTLILQVNDCEARSSALQSQMDNMNIQVLEKEALAQEKARLESILQEKEQVISSLRSPANQQDNVV